MRLTRCLRMPISNTKPLIIPYPPTFFPLFDKEHSITTHLNKLCMDRTHRKQQKATIVQGAKNIRILLDNGIQLNKLGVTVPEKWHLADDVQDPALDVLHNPQKWPAEGYYMSSIDVVRKFMGTSAQPGYHQLWAEVPTNSPKLPTGGEGLRRLLLLDRVTSERDMGEIIRAARGLAFDGGFICSASSAELFSPTTLRASRLQSMFWPCEGMSLGTATEKTTEWGFTPVYIRPLPASEIRHSRVGIPQFWREDGKQVDMEELKSKKIALVVSTNAKLSFSPQSICLSIPLAVSPSSSVKELTTLSIAQAASLTMAEIARMSDDAISQPKGLALSDIEDLEGRMLTRAVSATLGVARKLSPRQEAQRARKAERAKFTREWEREEQRVGKS